MSTPTARTSKRGSHWFPELALCKGPSAEGQTGAGTYFELFGYNWALSLDDANQLHLSQEQGGTWVEVTPLVPLPVLSGTARHITMAFDQAARPIIAWEDAGQIYLRQWDVGTSSYLTRGPWPGRDPVLWWDYPLDRVMFPASIQAGNNSDVLLFHIAGSQVGYRLQRESFATWHPLTALPPGYYLDQVVMTGSGYGLALGNDAGEAIYLNSDAFAWRYADPLRLTARPASLGIYASTLSLTIGDPVRLSGQPVGISTHTDTAGFSAADTLRLYARPVQYAVITNTANVSAADTLRLSARPTGAVQSTALIMVSSNDSLRLAARPVELRRKPT